MSIKALMSNMKREGGTIVKALDDYLISLSSKDSDRAIDVNAPSQAGNCLRCNYYQRLQHERDGALAPRSRRIFDNGSGMHTRLQGYMLDAGILIMDEVPLRNDKYNIQGHTDGIIRLGAHSKGVLELKSINSRGFGELKDAKPEHKMQGMTYLFCLEQRRQYLRKKYKTKTQFDLSVRERKRYYESLYTHLKDGRKFTREEKLAHQIELHLKADRILYNTAEPIDTVVFIYENKDDQELKEFQVKLDEDLLDNILDRYSTLNKNVKLKKPPKREGKNKSDSFCRYCDFKIECWC